MAQIPLEEKPESIAKIIKKLGKKLKTETNLVSITETIPCNDKLKLKELELSRSVF